jgi:hypothetical protein
MTTRAGSDIRTGDSMTGERGVWTWICGLCGGTRRRLSSMLTYAYIGHHDGGLFICPRCDKEPF